MLRHYENIKRAGRLLALALKPSAEAVEGTEFAILAGTGVPAGATYGEQTLEAAQKAIALRTDAPDLDSAFYLTLNGGTLWTAGKFASSAWYTGTTTPAADSVAGVHAAVAGTAANAFPGPFTAMDVDRTAKCVFGVGWDGGNVAITSTSPLGVAQTETITSPGAGGGTVLGVKPIKAGTAITAAKTVIGANPATVSIGRSHTYGLRHALTANVGVVTCDGVNDDTTWSTTYNSFEPTQPPNGARVFAYAHIG